MTELVMWIIYFCSLYFAIFWLLVLIAGNKRERKKFEEWPSASVVIPAYNEEEHIVECIQSVLNLDYPKEKLEVIAVNDGSTDNTLNEMEKFGDKIKIISFGKNSGKKAIPLNAGLKQANGEYVACLDSDSIVAPYSLKKMLEAFADDNIGAVTPGLKVYNPRKMIEKLQWLEYLFAIFLRKLQSFIDCIYVTPGPFTVYRRDILEKLGYFDEENITEDMEMALRLQTNNYRIENVEDADVYSSSPDTISKLYRQRQRWYEGLLSNSSRYRRVFFNLDYGNFGILMPLNVLSVFVLMISASLFTYYMLEPLIKEFFNLYLIGFDLKTYFSDLHLDIILLDLNYTKLFVVLAVLAIGVLTLFLSHKMSKENILKHGLKPVMVFIMLYFIFLGYMWLGVMTRLVFGSRKNW